MPGVYDGAEVLVWVNMAEPTQAQSVYGTSNAAFTVTSNTAGANSTLRFAIATPAGSGSNVVSVAYAAGTIDITLSPPSTGGNATAAKAVEALNASPAAKYYVTASLGASTGASPIAAAVAVGLLGVNGTTNTLGADASGTANFQPVSRQQGVDFEDTMDTIDAVSKGDRFALQLAGRQSGSFELAGLHSFEDATQERIRRAYQRRELVLFRRIYPATVAGSTVVHEAQCRVTGFSISEPDSDVATFSAPVALQENWRVV
jgi:hypothetical protein